MNGVMSLNYPNIFTAQSKEFSQDAFIDWLLRCADPDKTKDAPLLACGRAFITLLIEKHNSLLSELENWNVRDHGLSRIEQPAVISTVEVKRQYLRIDVLGIVNGFDGVSIIFENKLGTGIHDDQLKRYRDLLGKAHPEAEDRNIGVYYKVMEEKDYEEVRYKHRFCTLSREEMIDFLSSYTGINPIIDMYFTYLEEIEREISAWREVLADDLSAGKYWHNGMWNGFLSSVYRALKERMRSEENYGLGWGWINNTAGGFHGLWLGQWKTVDKKPLVTAYLQCDEHQVKVRMSGPRTGQMMRDTWHRLRDGYGEEVPEHQPKRMQHNAGSAEIGNLGNYIVPDAAGNPDAQATAANLFSLYQKLKVVSQDLRES